MSQKFLLVLIIILFVATCGIGIALINLNAKIDSLAVIGNPPISADNTPRQAQNSSAEEKKGASRELAITDEGYSPAGFQASAGETTVIKITNNGQKVHSFAIDELDIDSGLIDPGQTKEIIMNKQFAEPKNYTFHSNADGDDPQTFTGVLMVLK